MHSDPKISSNGNLTPTEDLQHNGFELTGVLTHFKAKLRRIACTSGAVIGYTDQR
jgi:hypothetical protein